MTMLSFMQYNYEMDKAVLKNLGNKTHDFKHRLEYVTNELRIESERQFREFITTLDRNCLT